MTERQPITEGIDVHSSALGEVMTLLRTLHKRSLHHRPDDEHVIERMLPQLGPETRSMLLANIRTFERRLRRHFSRNGNDNEQQLNEILAQAKLEKTSAMFAENLYDSLLSTPAHPIHAKRYGQFLFNNFVRQLMRDKASPQEFRKIAWVSFDMNGVKAMIDCTTYENATKYLQSVVRFFLDRHGKTRQHLERECGIVVTPLTAGGDEFALFLKSPTPLSPEFLAETVRSYQAEMENDQTLNGFVDFDDPAVIMNSHFATDEEREGFSGIAPDAMAEMLHHLRKPLLDRLISSMAGGGATLEEGIRRAREMGGLSMDPTKETFDSARQKMHRHLVELAEMRQCDDKIKFKKELFHTNRKLYDYLLRNAENRRLSKKRQDLEQRLGQVERENTELHGTNEELFRTQEELRCQIDSLLRVEAESAEKDRMLEEMRRAQDESQQQIVALLDRVKGLEERPAA